MNNTENEETPADSPTPVIDSSEMFQGDREIWLEYAGERYLLRITLAGKLLLTK